MPTVNLHIAYVEAGQAQKEVTINAAFDTLDAAIGGVETAGITVTDGSLTLTGVTTLNVAGLNLTAPSIAPSVVQDASVLTQGGTLSFAGACVPGNSVVYLIGENNSGTMPAAPANTTKLDGDAARFGLYGGVVIAGTLSPSLSLAFGSGMAWEVAAAVSIEHAFGTTTVTGTGPYLHSYASGLTTEAGDLVLSGFLGSAAGTSALLPAGATADGVCSSAKIGDCLWMRAVATDTLQPVSFMSTAATPCGVIQAVLRGTGPGHVASIVPNVPAALAFLVPGVPAAGALYNLVLPTALTLPANFAGAVVYAGTVPAADAVLTLNHVTSTGTVTALGTVTLTAGTHATATLSTQAAVALPAGDVLQLALPATADTAMADLGLTLLATRT